MPLVEKLNYALTADKFLVYELHIMVKLQTVIRNFMHQASAVKIQLLEMLIQTQ